MESLLSGPGFVRRVVPSVVGFEWRTSFHTPGRVSPVSLTSLPGTVDHDRRPRRVCIVSPFGIVVSFRLFFSMNRILVFSCFIFCPLTISFSLFGFRQRNSSSYFDYLEIGPTNPFCLVSMFNDDSIYCRPCKDEYVVCQFSTLPYNIF